MANQFISSLTQEQAARLSARDIELLQDIEAKANGEKHANSFVERRLEELRQAAEDNKRYEEQLKSSFC